MPSFDIVSEVDAHELQNAIDQTNREIANRFDLKSTSAKVEQDAYQLVIVADAEFHISQVLTILQGKLAKRGIDIDCLQLDEIETTINAAKQPITVRHGIDKEVARKLVQQIKEMKIKLQAQIQQDQVRVSGKKRDDLQTAIAKMKELSYGQPLQFTNFRD